MVFDHLFAFDDYILNGQKHAWGMKFLTFIPMVGHVLRDDGPVLAPIIVNSLSVYLKGRPTLGSTNMRLRVTVNAVLKEDLAIVHSGDGQTLSWGPIPSPFPLPFVSFTINPGDVVDIRLVPDGLAPLKPFLHSVLVTLGEAVGWWFDMGLPGGHPALPAGTYYRVIDI